MFSLKDFFIFDNFPRQEVPVNSRVEVVVTQYVKPDEFYVVLKQNTEIASQLMQSLADSYGAVCKILLIPPHKLVPSMVCCAPWREFGFHRVKIIDLKPFSKDMKVYFLDYGTTDEIAKSSAHYLLRKFFDLPAQAVRCKLENCLPAAHKKHDLDAVEDHFGKVAAKGISIHVNAICEDHTLSVDVFLQNGNTLLKEYEKIGYSIPQASESQKSPLPPKSPRPQTSSDESWLDDLEDELTPANERMKDEDENENVDLPGAFKCVATVTRQIGTGEMSLGAARDCLMMLQMQRSDTANDFKSQKLVGERFVEAMHTLSAMDRQTEKLKKAIIKHSANKGIIHSDLL